MNIRVLNQCEIDMIAAGEIVVNIQSILKELIENAIDANATNIIIKIKNNTVIEIIDNGHGMSKENLLLCTKRYATSKFTNINNINTLGFRGEGLYAISSVCHLTIASNNYIYHNNIDEITPYPTNNGTHISISNIFYNIPARRKFIHKKYFNIESFLEPYIILYKHIKFDIFINNKRRIINSTIETIFETHNNTSIEFAHKNTYYNVSGIIFIGHKYKSFIYLNKRILQDRKLMNIVRNTYSALSGYTSVSFMLNIECDVSLYDVNVHPSKYEVEFYNDTIFDVIENAIKIASNYWQIKYEEKNNTNTNNVWLLQECASNLLHVSTINKQYIVYTYDNKITLLDMHAAHERIMFNKIINNNAIYQILILPIQYTLQNNQIFLWASNYMKKIFIYDINDRIITITSAVNFLNMHEINDIIYNSYTQNDVDKYINDILHEAGCKNAVKSGYNISESEAIDLLNELLLTANYSICNHGRPTIISLTTTTLKNMFHRNTNT